MSAAQTKQLIEAITGAWRTRAVYEGVQSGLIDNLDQNPATAEQLAKKLSLDAPTSIRILRALAVLGLCKQASPDTFVATEMGTRLRAGVPGSLRGMAMMWGDRTWKSLETIGGTLKTAFRVAAMAISWACTEIRSNPISSIARWPSNPSRSREPWPKPAIFHGFTLSEISAAATARC